MYKLSHNSHSYNMNYTPIINVCFPFDGDPSLVFMKSFDRGFVSVWLCVPWSSVSRMGTLSYSAKETHAHNRLECVVHMCIHVVRMCI